MGDLVHDRGCCCWSGVEPGRAVGIPGNTSRPWPAAVSCGGRVGSGGVFVRTSTRRNADGTRVSYLQLAHNEWDPAAKTTRTKVLYSFGRADQLDRAAIERLIGALTRLLGTEPPPAVGPGPGPSVGVPGLAFVESRPLGGAWLLDRLWHRLGIDTLLRRLAGRTRRDPVVERVLFALVANRALAPSSKLAATSWIAHDVHLPGLTGSDYRVSDDACYRAMDWLISVRGPAGARGVRRGGAPAQPGSRPDLLRHHQHLLRDRAGRRAGLARRHGRVLPTAAGTAARTAAPDGDGGARGRRGEGGVPHPRQVQGLPRRPAPGGGRDGRDPGRDPGAGVVLAGQHQRLAADPPGQGRAAGLDPGPGDLGRRPRVHLRRPTVATLPPARTATSSGRSCAPARPRPPPRCPAKAATSRSRENLRVKEVKVGRARAVRGLPQPRRRRPRRRHPRTAHRPAGGDDRRLRPAHPDEAGRAARGDLHPARPAPVPAHHPLRAAAPGRGAGRRGRETGRQVPAAHQRSAPEQPRTSPWATSNCSRSNAAGGT